MDKDKPVATLTPREILNISYRSAELHHRRIILKLNTYYLPRMEAYALQHNLTTTIDKNHFDQI